LRAAYKVGQAFRFLAVGDPSFTCGRKISRKDAGHCVVECYEGMLACYSKHCPDG
jgi:hypothetical protein